MSRRHCLAGLAALPAAAPLSAATGLAAKVGGSPLPDKASFHPQPSTYLDNGSVHPLPRVAKAAMDDYATARAVPGLGSAQVEAERILGNFARLINADPDEVAFVQSTTTAEHMIVDGLGLFHSNAHIVTDTLHFFGSFPLYEGLARQGAQVSWVRARDGRIRLEDMEKAITGQTRLVALSLVSTYNGFEHDLTAVCRLAHAQGALVYADIVHAAGCVPVDVKATGVDFAACSSYKWLMGDFGLGFVFASKQAMARLQRKRFGYYGVASFQSHVYPLDPPGERVADFEMQPGATGHFATGTYNHAAAVALDQSLQYILGLNVARINAHARTLCDRLKAELPKLGYQMVTPIESRAPIVTCVLENARTLSPGLDEAKVRMTVSRNRFRITPSVFNDMDDIDRLLRLLGQRPPAN